MIFDMSILSTSKTICLTVCVYLLPFSLVQGADVYSDEELKLIDYFTTRCDTSPDLFSWPIGFEHPSDKLACDTIASLELPYNIKNRFLFSKANTWGKPEYVRLGEELSKDYLGADDYAVLQASDGTIESSVREANILDPVGIKALSTISDPSAYDVNFEKLLDAYPKEFVSIVAKPPNFTHQEIEKILDWLSKNFNKVPPYILTASVNKIYSSLWYQADGLTDVLEQVHKMDPKVQRQLLGLWSSVPLNDRGFLEVLRSIVWTASNHISGHTVDGFTKDFKNENPFAKYFSAIRQLEDVKLGLVPNASPTFLIATLYSYRGGEIDLTRFDKYYPFASYLFDHIESTNKYLLTKTNLQLSDIITGNEHPWAERYLAMELFTVFGKNKNMLSISPLLSNISSKERESLNAWLQAYSRNHFKFAIFNEKLKVSNDTKQISSIIRSNSEVVLDLCNIDQGNDCFRVWQAFYNDWHGWMKQEPGSEYCDFIDKNDEKIVKKLFKNLITDQIILKSCRLRDTEILSNGSISIPNSMLELVGLPSPMGGYKWVENIDVSNGSLAGIGMHYIHRFGSKYQPLPFNGRALQQLYDRYGWSFYKRLLQHADKAPDDVTLSADASLHSYASLEVITGRFTQAFKDILKGLANSPFEYRNTEELAKLFFLGKMLGIPRSYLSDVIKNTDTFNKPVFVSNTKWDLLNDYYDAYMLLDEKDLSNDNILSSAPNEIFKGLGKVASLTSDQKYDFCENDDYRRRILKEDRGFQEYVDFTSWAGAFASIEYGNLFSICKLADYQIKSKYLSDTEKLKVAKASYNELLRDSFVPFIIQNRNFIDLRYLDSVIAFSQLSAAAESKFGLVFSIQTLKLIYLELIESFVLHDSMTLRTEQSRIEDTLTSIGVSLAKLYEKGVIKDKLGEVGLFEEFASLAVAAHNPILNDKVRMRMLGLPYGNVLALERFENYAKEKLESLKKERQILENSKNIFEYVSNQPTLSLSSDVLYFTPFLSSNSMNNPKIAVSIQKSQSTFLNLISDGEDLFAIGVNSDGKIFTFNATVNLNLESLRNEIDSSYGISQSTATELCKGLISFHEKIRPIFKRSKFLLLSPSVNLMPLPSEFLFGDACDTVSAHTPVILVNDYSGALQFIEEKLNSRLPSTMVGIANPIESSGEFSNLLSDFRGGEVKLKSRTGVDLNMLPPLPDAEIEVTNAAKFFKNYHLLLGPDASIREGLAIATKQPSLVVLATHGFTADSGEAGDLPGLLSVEESSLSLFPASDIYSYDLTGSTVVLSACDTAAGFSKNPDLIFTGFVKTIADSGADFIVSSKWPVDSVASREVTEKFTERWASGGDIVDSVYSAKSVPSSDTEGTRWPFVFIYP
jgi:hypothetical protein